MSKSKISYLNISPYSRHSPSLQLKTGLKKQSNSVERPKSGKAYYAGSTTRGHTPINNPEAIDRKYSPFGEGKGDMGDSLRQFYKTKNVKDKPSSAKPSKTRDLQTKKPLKSGVRPLDKGNEKLGIYHYINSKSTKNLQDVRSEHPSGHVTPSRQGSRSNFHDEKDNSHDRKIPQAGIFQHKQLIEALEEMRKSKGKLSNHGQNQSQTSLLNKATAQKPPQSSSGKVVQYSSVSLAKPKKDSFEPSRRPSDQIKNNIFKDLKLASKKASEVIQPKEEILQKSDLQQQQHHAAQKKHRRGLSSGQNPLFLEQQMAMEQLALERERMKQMQLLQQQQLQQQQQQLLLQQQQQQQQQMQQMQMQMQQQYMRDPQQEEDEFYEEFFHMDKMTFGFEKLMISQKINQNNSSTTPTASPTQSKQSGHHRTRSIEENTSMMPTTKSSSRWTTKKSSIDGEHQGHERFNMLEHISEFDKSDIEKETLRRYYKQR